MPVCWHQREMWSASVRETFLGFPRTGGLSKYSRVHKGSVPFEFWPLSLSTTSEDGLEISSALWMIPLHQTEPLQSFMKDWKGLPRRKILRAACWVTKTLWIFDVLAEEAVSRRDDPAGRDQGAGAEVELSDVNGCHPGMSTWQSWVSAHYPPPGNW